MSNEVYASDWRSRIPVVSSCFLPGSLGEGGVLFHLQDLKVRDNQLQNQSIHVLNLYSNLCTSKKNFFYLMRVFHVDTESQFLQIEGLEGKNMFAWAGCL